MKMEKNVEVKSKSKDTGKSVIVAKVDIPEYESLTEMVGAEGEDTVLSLANTQNGTNIKNRARQNATQVPSKTRLREMAQARMSASDWQRVAQCSGDMLRINKIIDEKIEEIEKELSAKVGAEVEEEETVGA